MLSEVEEMSSHLCRRWTGSPATSQSWWWGQRWSSKRWSLHRSTTGPGW